MSKWMGPSKKNIYEGVVGETVVLCILFYLLLS